MIIMNNELKNTKKNSILRSILGLLTFSTILPIGYNLSLRDMVRMVWLWPAIHFFVGILGFVVAIISINIFNLPNLFSAAILYGFFLIITGFHHIDGIMDMADGVMVHGDVNKKIAVMKDSMVGSAGIVSFFLIGIVTLLGFANLLDYNFLYGIIIAEMASKVSLLTTCISSRPHSEGSAVIFVNSVNIINYTFSLIISIILAILVGGLIGFIGVLGGILGGGIISLIAQKNFKMANGDVLGASNEFGRMTSLILMLIFLGVIL